AWSSSSSSFSSFRFFLMTAHQAEGKEVVIGPLAQASTKTPSRKTGSSGSRRVEDFVACPRRLSSLLRRRQSPGLKIALQTPPALLALCSSLPILGASTVLTVMATGKRIFTRSLTVLSLPGNTTALC